MLAFFQKNKAERHYKLKRLYVANVYSYEGTKYDSFSDLSIRSFSCKGARIVYFDFLHIGFTDPITGEHYKRFPFFVGDLFCLKKELKNLYYHFHNISDEILLRGDYLTLEELIKYSRELSEPIH